MVDVLRGSVGIPPIEMRRLQDDRCIFEYQEANANSRCLNSISFCISSEVLEKSSGYCLVFSGNWNPCPADFVHKRISFFKLDGVESVRLYEYVRLLDGDIHKAFDVFKTNTDTLIITAAQRQEFEHTANLLTKTFADFGIHGKIAAIQPGPVVTVFEFEPDAGTKLSKMMDLTLVVLEALAYAFPDELVAYPSNIIKDADYIAAENFCIRQLGAHYTDARPPFLTYMAFPR